MQKLKTIIAFTGLVVGTPVVRTHGLNWNPNRSVVPDVISLDAGGYTVTANNLTISVTRNTSDAAASVNALCESWHSLERATFLSLNPQPIVIQGSSGGDATQFPFVNLNGAPYNLVPNDPSKAAQNTTGINLAISTWTGTWANLEAGDGDYYFGRIGTTNASIAVKGCSKLVFSGQGAQATRFIQQGDSAFGEWNLFTIDQSNDIEIHDLQVLQGTINNSDPTQENHVISVYNSGTGTRNINVHDIAFGKCIGDAFRVFANNIGDFVENVLINNFRMELHGVVDPDTSRVGGRSGLSLQRGYKNYVAMNGYIAGVQNQAIDAEPSGGAGIIMDGSLFDNIFVDGTDSAVDVDVSWGGESTGDQSQNCRVRNCTIINGSCTILSTNNLIVDGLTIDSSILFGNPAQPLITVRQINDGFKLVNLKLARRTGSGTGPVLDIENAGNSTEVLDFDVHQDTPVTSMHFDGCANARIRGRIVDTAGSAGSRDGIEFFGVVANADHCQVDSLQVVSTSTLQSAIGFYPRTPRSMKNIRCNGVMGNNVFYGVFLSYGVGSTPDLNPVLLGINAGVNETWRAENQGAAVIDTVFPCIGGNIGTNGAARYPSPRELTGNVAPNGACTGNLGDIYRYCPSSTTAQAWLKTSQSVAGTPDNTGWQQITGLT